MPSGDFCRDSPRREKKKSRNRDLGDWEGRRVEWRKAIRVDFPVPGWPFSQRRPCGDLCQDTKVE